MKQQQFRVLGSAFRVAACCVLPCFLALMLLPCLSPAQRIGSPEGGRRPIPYDPPNEQQVKFELNYGSLDSPSGSGGKIFWKKVLIKNFAVTGGDPVMTAETPECVSDRSINEIISTNALKVHANKGAIFLEGVGFLLQRTNMTLIVSNQVHSVLQLRPATNSIAPATEIFSHRGEFEMKPDATNGMALYIGNVHVLDPQMKLDCEWLKADLPKDSGQSNRPNHIVALTNVVIDFISTNGDQIHALGDQAVYDSRTTDALTHETLELTGTPRVNMSNGWMTADMFVMDRATGKLHGRGNVHLHFHPANQPETEIASDVFDYDMATREANFAGHVRVDDPRLKLTSAFFFASLPHPVAGAPNHLDHVVADTNVVMDFVNGSGTNQQTIHATGQKAIYDNKIIGGVTNEVLELSGNPAVQLEKGWMTADLIRLDRAQGRIWGSGNHHSVLKKSPGEPATTDTEIFSDDFDYSSATGFANYRKNVRAYDPGLNLRQADLLTVELAKGPSGATNIHKVVAEGNVSLDFAGNAFEAKDITNLTAFAARLKNPQDGVAKFVHSQLSTNTLQLLAKYNGGSNALLQHSLADDLNHITQSGPVYESSRFTNMYVSLEASQLLKQDAMGVDLIQLNRLLLLDAFRGELTRGRYGEKTHATGDRAVYTSQGKDPAASALLELFGHPVLINPSVTIEADDKITYDRVTKVSKFIGNPRFHSTKIGAFANASTPGKKELP
jgi:lipopolysaccharide export system protein LptA